MQHLGTSIIPATATLPRSDQHARQWLRPVWVAASLALLYFTSLACIWPLDATSAKLLLAAEHDPALQSLAHERAAPAWRAALWLAQPLVARVPQALPILLSGLALAALAGSYRLLRPLAGENAALLVTLVLGVSVPVFLQAHQAHAELAVWCVATVGLAAWIGGAPSPGQRVAGLCCWLVAAWLNLATLPLAAAACWLLARRIEVRVAKAIAGVLALNALAAIAVSLLARSPVGAPATASWNWVGVMHNLTSLPSLLASLLIDSQQATLRGLLVLALAALGLRRAKGDPTLTLLVGILGYLALAALLGPITIGALLPAAALVLWLALEGLAECAKHSRLKRSQALAVPLLAVGLVVVGNVARDVQAMAARRPRFGALADHWQAWRDAADFLREAAVAGDQFVGGAQSPVLSYLSKVPGHEFHLPREAPPNPALVAPEPALADSAEQALVVIERRATSEPQRQLEAALRYTPGYVLAFRNDVVEIHRRNDEVAARLNATRRLPVTNEPENGAERIARRSRAVKR